MKTKRLGLIVLIVYMILLIVNKNVFFSSLLNGGNYFVEMMKVMPVVFIFTVLIDVWIPRKVITSYLGDGSKRKGIVISFLVGMLSTGPIIVAFPVVKMLFKKGASIENVVIILSAWSVIKVPMLFNEIKFLGFEFMFVRWILTVVGIIFIAKLTSKLMKLEQNEYVKRLH
jgi:uncharacterized membrane protein YraQ (UPF0718 family)